MFSIWIYGILTSLGILRIIQIFGFSKAPSCINLEMIGKVFIILLLLWLWGYGNKTNQRVFFQKSVYVYSLLGQTDGRRKVFFGRDRERLCRVRLPQTALSFL